MSDNSFLPGLAAWATAMGEHDTPFLNEIKKYPRASRPIIGFTEDKRVFVHHVVRIGDYLQQRFARLVPVRPDDSRCSSSYDEDYDECDGLYERGQWRWVNKAAVRSLRLAPQPIYDMGWVDPNPPPTKMTWGYKDGGTKMGDRWSRVDEGQIQPMKVYDPTSSNQRIRELEKELEEFIADHNRLSDRYREHRLRTSKLETALFFSLLMNILLITITISLFVIN